MPIDPAIPLQVQQPNLAQVYGQVMQLKNMQQQQALAQQEAPYRIQALQQQAQLGGLQLEQQRQDLAARQALNDAYSGAMTTDASGNPTIDSQKLAQHLASGPAAYQTPAVLK